MLKYGEIIYNFDLFYSISTIGRGWGHLKVKAFLETPYFSTRNDVK